MSLLLAVCLVTGVMPQMAVKAETVSQEDMVDIRDTTVRSVSALENALQSVADVTQDSTGYIIVSLQKNIVGRINFMLHENVIFNANGHVVSGGTYAEPICLDHGSSYSSSGNYGTVELVGKGIYVSGKNNALFSGGSRKLVMRSGVVLGEIYRDGGVFETALENGYDSYDVKKVERNSGNTSYTINDGYVLNEGNSNAKTLEKCTEEVSFSAFHIYNIAVVPNEVTYTNIGDMTFKSDDEVANGLANVAEVTTGSAIKINIKLKENIKGRLNFKIPNAYIVLDANGKTIDGIGTNEAVCLEHDQGQTVELTGNGTYITGDNYAVYCGSGEQSLIIKSGIFEGRVYSINKSNNYTIALEDGKTSFDICTITKIGTGNYSFGEAVHYTQEIKIRDMTNFAVIPGDSSNNSGNTGNDNSNTGNDSSNTENGNSNTENDNSSTVTPAPEPQKPEIKPVTIVTRVRTTKGKLTLTWTPVNGADGYSVYTSVCNGKNNFKKQKETVKQTVTLNNMTGNKPYKLYVSAYKLEDGKHVELSRTMVLHIAINSDTYTNAKAITTEKESYTLNTGENVQIKAKTVKQEKGKKLVKHASEFRYLSADEHVATVTKDGTITAKGAGTCKIYVIANNGVYKELIVTVNGTK